ncbi:RidA family protein [Sinorhizobium mexicanum]|uniref:RidA family protein n=1 Tax=Sinorhizobium mexicanum TaxID=375549 RepID=A0A859QPD9_9HYPH|nr:RidA family protein [Sinorhizobium mexicanum]MBP1886487.1 enamine deaminase RidA (YjgF/YER057c/UK114 family) [Sinorhizobium mexicanum]QLL63937.1 RidA family protein [Sinorhizobium mexicanum]
MNTRYIEPTANFHRAVVKDSLAFISGLVADDGNASVEIQTDQVLSKLERQLQVIGSGLDDVLSATIFLTDMSKKPAMNEVWRKRFTPDRLPARATIGVSDLDGPYLIEVTAIAVCKGG